MTSVLECHDSRRDLLRQVRGEFLELPGLRLTLAQACRLWGRDAAVSRDVLDALVEISFLTRQGSRYVRADAGSVGI